MNQDNKLRILYSSNAIWTNSGYGVQGRSLLPRLAELETVGGRQNIAQFAWYGLQGGMHEWDGFRIYPSGVDPYGNDIVQAHAQNFQANVVISLIDAWVMDKVGTKVKPALWLPWLPIDHDPVPQRVLDSIADAYLPLTYAKWGHEMLNKLGIKNYYIPHGIEPSVYKVLPTEQVEAFKQQYLKFNGHLTIMVAANKGYPDRKNFQGQLAAWAAFAKNKPDAKLYLHTEPNTMYQGLNLPRLIAELGIADKVMFPDRYEYFIGLPAEYLAYIYNSANVLMGAAMSEGFGIPLIEAQACGTPVITTDFSAMPELVRYGNIVDVATKVWTPLEAYQVLPNQ
ncbi:MAG: glycosyltransferase, partial [Neisseriaceae bacterium]